KAGLDAEYKKSLAELNKRYDTQSMQITTAKRDKKGELTKLDIKAKEQAKQIKVKQTNLKRKFDKDKAGLTTQKKVKAKIAEQEKAKLASRYKRTVNQLDAKHKKALTDINDKAKAQATQTAQTKNANKAALAALDSKAKKQAKQIETEKANLKRKFDKDKKIAKAEYEQAKKRKMTKQERGRLDAQYKNNLRRLKAESKDALAKVRSKADAQASQIAQAKSDNKAELEALNAVAKKQAKQIKFEKVNLKRKLAKDKTDAEQQYKHSLAKTDVEYKDKLSRLQSEHKEALSKLNEDAKTQTLQIAQAKTEKKAELAALKDEAKKQAKQIKAEKANLKRDLAKDKADAKKQYSTAKLDSEYRDKLGQLEEEYKKSMAMLDEALQMTKEKQQIEDEYQQMIAKAHIRLRHRKEKQRIAKIVLSQDTTLPLAVKEIRISGNNLISTAELLEELPLLYNASDKPLEQADSSELYDLSTVREVILEPGKPRQITVRTIQGLTQLILSVYQSRNYGGIYVYVPSETLKEAGKLQDDILLVKVLEASVSNVTITHYDPENEKVEKGYLRDSAVSHWSPIKVDDVANRKELDEFVNLLNLNPDRYVSAVVSKGIEPNSLALGYNVYEANPWHWFFQIDNSGTKDRQWAPRVGLINTNLLGIDDTFTAIYQAPWESDIDENYLLYGSYDFPLLGPWLRLNLFGGYNEFDVSGGDAIDFLGNGEFYGGTLRYNVFQKDKWFFDVTSTLSHEESKVTPSLFPQFLGTDIKMDLWGYGVDIHHHDDMSDTSLTFNRIDSFGGSDADEFMLARTNAERDFSILTTTANHSQYLDDDKIQRFSGSFRWITVDERLVPAKMTAFGGMYTVRGYDEYEIIADSGILASVQYEFDLVAHEESQDIDKTESEQTGKKKPFLRKLAPLAFLDYGLAKIEEPLTTEHKDQELCSAGAGVLVELGDNFSGAVYYGYPLIKTDDTRTGKGRLNIGLVMRW
ncbi:MAG: ShlB/FhaC/HecB family hemolysin secretion/activation protein, partial [Planctomycetota bacterium]